jgi:uncharacterized protein HemY
MLEVEMKVFWLFLLCAVSVALFIAWREAPVDVRVQTRWFMRKHVLGAMLIIAAILMALLALSSFSLKLF